jgi:hypothetical protein
LTDFVLFRHSDERAEPGPGPATPWPCPDDGRRLAGRRQHGSARRGASVPIRSVRAGLGPERCLAVPNHPHRTRTRRCTGTVFTTASDWAGLTWAAGTPAVFHVKLTTWGRGLEDLSRSLCQGPCPASAHQPGLRLCRSLAAPLKGLWRVPTTRRPHSPELVRRPPGRGRLTRLPGQTRRHKPCRR